ncbi:MAG: hypothetical protein EA339_06865 [Rhodobacteraceae bacterium]|nr:MAG: hypothetical protein EA339_06865 [Paracoccaceae bacterium]
MDLRETSPIPTAALPLAEFRAHLRLGSGFVDETTQDATLEQFLRAAIASVEARVSRALFQRTFELRLSAWRGTEAQRLPVAPVVALGAVTLINAAGGQSPVAAGRLRLDADSARPRVIGVLPTIPTRGQVVIAFTAGFATDWAAIPSDLRQAVLLLAAQYYEARDTGGDADMAFGIRALLERWRDIRIGGRA